MTGAAAGIGHASALAFADAGYRVVLVDRDADALQSRVEKIAGRPGTSVTCPIPAQVAETFASIAASHARIDALHANAGVSTYALFEDMSSDEIRRQLDVNLLSHLYCVRGGPPAAPGAGVERDRLHGLGAGLPRASGVRAVCRREERVNGGRAGPRGGARRSRHPCEQRLAGHDRHPDAAPRPRRDGPRSGRRLPRTRQAGKCTGASRRRHEKWPKSSYSSALNGQRTSPARTSWSTAATCG